VKAALSSLRFRFIASTCALIAVGLLLTGIAVTKLMRLSVERGYHEEMQIHIEELAALVKLDKDGRPFLLRRLSDPRFLVPNSGFYWEIRRANFAPLKSPSMLSGDLSGTLSTGVARRWAFTQGPSGKVLEYGMLAPLPNGAPPILLAIGSDAKLIDATVASFATPLAWSLTLLAVLMLLAGVAQIAFGLRPLHRLMAGVADIRSGKAAAMVGDFPREIQPLVSDLNSLLDANAAIVHRARIQAGNLAHGLRTPLAIIIDEAEQLSANGQPDSAKILLQECDRMQRQIKYHLARARTAAAQPGTGQIAMLKPTLEPILRAMRRLHAEREILLCCGNFPDVAVACDDVDLGEMLSIVIDNAFKWAKTRVMVSWEVQDRDVSILVDDDGSGLSTTDAVRAFEAGERLNDSAPGSGLGLAIVKDLTKLYGGSVQLGNSPLGGLRANIQLPTLP
jgi:signal transduction histidine kinase